MTKNHSSFNSSINVVHNDDIACHELKWIHIDQSNSSDQIHHFYFIESLCNKFLIWLSIWSSSNLHKRIIFSRFFISLRTTIESMSTRKLFLKTNWILSSQIINFLINTSITYSINETLTIEKIIFCETSFETRLIVE